VKTEIICENLRNLWIKKIFFGNHDPRFLVEGKPIGLEPASVRQTSPTRSCFRGGLYVLALPTHPLGLCLRLRGSTLYL